MTVNGVHGIAPSVEILTMEKMREVGLFLNKQLLVRTMRIKMEDEVPMGCFCYEYSKFKTCLHLHAYKIWLGLTRPHPRTIADPLQPIPKPGRKKRKTAASVGGGVHYMPMR